MVDEYVKEMFNRRKIESLISDFKDLNGDVYCVNGFMDNLKKIFKEKV